MKSLVMKDLYNVGHNMKSTLVVIFFMGVFITFTSDGDTSFYSIFCAVMFSMMVITSFSYDTLSNWEHYAMILPVTRRDVVRGKFAVLLLLSLTGAVLGLLVGLLSAAIVPNATLDLGEQAFYMLPSFTVSIFMGSTSIPLIFKFGAEKARLMLMATFVLPALLLIAVLKLMEQAGVHLTDQMVVTFFTAAPVLVLVWAYVMYRISCGIFQKKEL